MKALKNAFRTLKNPDILKKKPHLKLCSNHFVDDGPVVRRMWVSAEIPSRDDSPRCVQGTAVRDGDGWYVKQPTQ